MPGPRLVVADAKDPLSQWFADLTPLPGNARWHSGGYAVAGDAVRACQDGACRLVNGSDPEGAAVAWDRCVPTKRDATGAATEYQCAIADADAAVLRGDAPSLRALVCPD